MRVRVIPLYRVGDSDPPPLIELYDPSGLSTPPLPVRGQNDEFSLFELI